MRGARPLAVATVGLVLVASSGCSILFAKGPPERVERGQQIHCTRSYAAPVIDGIVAGSNVATTAYAISVSDAAYAKIPPYSRSAAIALGVGYAALYGISMGVGISRVGDCNELLERVGSRPDPARRRAIVGPGAPAPVPVARAEARP